MWHTGLVALRHVCYLPRPQMKPGPPALAGRFFTTEPPEKPCESENVSHSVMSYSATPWTVAHQAPLSMEFSRQEHWSGLPFPSGDLPNPGVEPWSLELAGRFFSTEPRGKPCGCVLIKLYLYKQAAGLWAMICTSPVLG